MSSSIPITVAKAAPSTVVSKVGTMKAGHELKGRPPMFIGYSITDVQYCSAQPPAMPSRPAGERELRHVRLVQVQRVEHVLHRVGRVGVHLAVAGRVDRLGGLHDLLRGVELGQEPVERLGAAHRSSSAGWAAGTSVRISKIEIVGRKRMNRKNSVRNRPIVPMNIDQSKIVPR